MNKLLSVTVRSNSGSYDFNFYGDPAQIPAWRADGLEVYQVENLVPMLIAELGLTRPWCFAQDLFGFRNPWRRT